MAQGRKKTASTANGTYANGTYPNGNALNGSAKAAVLASKDEKTDYSRWRLLDERGRQTWHYLEADEDVKEWPQSVADKYHLGLPTVI
jgi:lanosterol synthase